MSPSPDKPLLVYITHPDGEQATALARACLEKKLVACANLHAPVTSLYHWEGKLCQDREWVLICKTTESCWEPLERLVQELHPAQCPCILALPIAHGHAPFLQWLQSCTASRREHPNRPPL